MVRRMRNEPAKYACMTTSTRILALRPELRYPALVSSGGMIGVWPLFTFLRDPPPHIRRLFGAVMLGLAMLVLPWMGAEPSLAPPGDGYTDKILHVLCFMGLGILGFWAYRSRRGRVLVVVLLLILGIGIELVQGMVPERQASVEDVVADVAGLVVAIILLRQWPLARDMLFDRIWKAGRQGD